MLDDFITYPANISFGNATDCLVVMVIAVSLDITLALLYYPNDLGITPHLETK